MNHAYLGTEARAFGPLSGALLAFLYPPRGDGRHGAGAAPARCSTSRRSARWWG